MQTRRRSQNWISQHNPVVTRLDRGLLGSNVVATPRDLPSVITNAHMSNGLEETSNLRDKILWMLRLGLILVLVSIPSFVLLLFRGTHQVLARVPPFFWGSWAVFSIWIILAKGLPYLFEQRKEILGPVWLFLGLSNLIAAISGLCFL
jgi:hypothetical protein